MFLPASGRKLNRLRKSTSVQPAWICSSICVVSRTNFPQVCPRILTPPPPTPLQCPLLLVPIQTCSFLMSETQVCRELRLPGGSSAAAHTSKRRRREISKRVARRTNPLLSATVFFRDQRVSSILCLTAAFVFCGS